MRTSKRPRHPAADAEAGVSARPASTLEILADETVSEMIVKPHAAAFLAAHPHLSVGFRQRAFAPDASCEGVDLVLQYAPAAAALPGAATLGAQRLLTCAAPSYLRARGVPNTPAELCAQRHDAVIVSETQPRAWQFANPSRAVDVAPRRRVTAPSLSAALALALGSAGIARLPECWAIGLVRSGRLVRLLPDREPRLHLLARTPHGGRHPGAGAFLRFIRTLLDTGAAPVLQRTGME